MIISVGEALIDRIDGKDYVGGGPLNVALAVARLNSPSSFVGGISSDDNGSKILTHIVDNCILFEPGFCSRPEPTLIHGGTDLKDWKNTSAFFMDEGLLENVYKNNVDINAVCFGSLNFIVEKNCDIILGFLKNHPDIIGYFDPNIRMKAIDDFDGYKKQIEKACLLSDIVKVSDEDLSFWGVTESKVFELCKHHLLVTRGAKGATWYSKDLGFDKPVSIDGIRVPVADTVGCGDCFNGAVLHWLDTNKMLNKEGLKLKEDSIYQALFFAVCAASVNASRNGCNPPTMEDMA